MTVASQLNSRALRQAPPPRVGLVHLQTGRQRRGAVPGGHVPDDAHKGKATCSAQHPEYELTLQELEENQLVDLPLETEPLKLFMYWHDASKSDPGLIWLREQIETILSPRE